MTKLAITVHPNLDYGERDGTRLTFDHYQPASPNGAAILVVNSGDSSRASSSSMCKLRRRSINFLAPMN